MVIDPFEMLHIGPLACGLQQELSRSRKQEKMIPTYRKKFGKSYLI